MIQSMLVPSPGQAGGTCAPSKAIRTKTKATSEIGAGIPLPPWRVHGLQRTFSHLSSVRTLLFLTHILDGPMLFHAVSANTLPPKKDKDILPGLRDPPTDAFDTSKRFFCSNGHLFSERGIHHGVKKGAATSTTSP